MSITRHRSSRHKTHPAPGPVCPACGGSIAADAVRCPNCSFTGQDTLKRFGYPPPPLMPLLDAAILWSEAEQTRIESARQRLHRRFPQFRFHVCSVALPAGENPALFGFWMLNTCPLYQDETTAQRAWAVLLLIDITSQSASVVSGYAAEHWLADADWAKALGALGQNWQSNDTSRAVVGFFRSAERLLEQAWLLRGIRRANPSVA